ncbi:MAG: hypothetical protein U1E05_05495 [Patescibacteria group bacterium]|nr:hypothetical protein [Patescibacteria group bacterium]
MDIDSLRAFFGWCTVINGVFLLLTFGFVFSAQAGSWVYRMHGRWFPMTREAFTLAMYGFMGAMKILFIMLNLVPYLALVLMR